jgi:DNA uptake protein ComE-like DNA-binding protein
MQQIKKMNINEATEDDLLKIQGIGSVKAKRIIEERPYINMKDIKNKVSGIGEDLLYRLGLNFYANKVKMLLDLNTTNSGKLKKINDLNKDDVKKIIKNQPFKSWSDLQKKTSICDDLVEKIKIYFCIKRLPKIETNTNMKSRNKSTQKNNDPVKERKILQIDDNDNEFIKNTKKHIDSTMKESNDDKSIEKLKNKPIKNKKKNNDDCIEIMIKNNKRYVASIKIL